MKRRNSGDETAVAGRDGGDHARRSATDPGHGWAAGWADTWGERERQRVAQWLTSKGRVAVHVPAAPEAARGAVRPVDPWEVDIREEGPPVAPDAAAAAPAPVEVVEAPPVEQLHARAALEAELAYLEEERRRLTAALAEEREEADRVRRELSMAASMLHEHLAGLEQERRRVLAGVESAVASAEQARADEQAARASLETARAEARVVEAKHFEVWIALDREVSALVARRRRLRALRRHRRPGAAAPAS